MLVYILTNLANGKYYVGKTSKPSLSKYLRDAISLAIHGKDNRPLLHRAIRKYGAGAFIIEPLAECETNEQAILLERAWIACLDSRNHSIGYNLSEGGEGSHGVKHSAETKALWSAQRKGQVVWNKGITYHNHVPSKQVGKNNPFFGKHHSQNTRAIVAASNAKRVWTPEMRDRMSIAQKKRYEAGRVAVS